MPVKWITITELNGRNGSDPPLALLDDQAVEMLNVDRYDGLIGRKRGGSASLSLTCSAGGPFAGVVAELARFVPGADEAAAELWARDGTGQFLRLAASTQWVEVTPSDALVTGPVIFATLNGKLFMAFDTTVDRLHCWDGSSLRRVGLQTPTAAPTVADTGVGAYAAVARYYRVRWLHLSGTTVVRRSEPSAASTVFTPSGAGAFARVTRPTAPGEGETHWELESSADANTWTYLYGQATGSPAAPVAIGTTTADDGTTVASYLNNPSTEIAGTYTVPTSAKYLLSDGNRLLLAGAWESGGKNSRIWFTPVLGSTDKADDERIPNTVNQKNFVDINENDGGAITALGGPIFGVPYAFKYRRLWRLIPTGDVTAPYIPRQMSTEVGAISHQAICVGRDQGGNPALYFLSPDGPYRIVQIGGVSVLQYLGRDIEDIWATVNLGASNIVAHALYYPALHQVWFHVSTGSGTEPAKRLVFDVLLGEVQGDYVRKGWFHHTGDAPSAYCSTMFANTVGASMSKDLKPYIGRSSGTAIQKCDTSDLNDAGTNFQAYVESKPLAVAPLGYNAAVGQSHLLAEAASGVTITQTLIRDYGIETRTSTALLTATGSESRVLKKLEGSDLAQAGTIQARIGDGSALASAWVIDALSIPVTVQDVR